MDTNLWPWALMFAKVICQCVSHGHFFLINCVHFFVEDDATYLSSFRTGDVWRLGVPADATKAVAVTPSGLKENVPVFEQRAVLRGDKQGYYDLTATSEGAEVKTEFAANLLDVTESGIAPKGPLTVDGKVAGSVSGLALGSAKRSGSHCSSPLS